MTSVQCSRGSCPLGDPDAGFAGVPAGCRRALRVSVSPLYPVISVPSSSQSPEPSVSSVFSVIIPRRARHAHQSRAVDIAPAHHADDAFPRSQSLRLTAAASEAAPAPSARWCAASSASRTPPASSSSVSVTMSLAALQDDSRSKPVRFNDVTIAPSMTFRAAPGLLAGALVALVACHSVQPRSPKAAEDWSSFGNLENVLRWTPEQQLRGYRNIDRIYPTRPVTASPHPFPLPDQPTDFSGLRYTVGTGTFDINAFISHNHIVGLLAIRDGNPCSSDMRRATHRTHAGTLFPSPSQWSRCWSARR